ncbi:hypothetical protein G6F57_009773 [Rhizopus arrhizus]|nr:hypothetical protein G6F22_005612 [Rhizopus arrhizus]KAG1272797.1 hypothetical protein G6F65_011459 [Rhizopus arrhizus]KAG1475430.1 hypothetical protein G6F57_009773 [Rhizopus arrhizus]
MGALSCWPVSRNQPRGRHPDPGIDRRADRQDHHSRDQGRAHRRCRQAGQCAHRAGRPSAAAAAAAAGTAGAGRAEAAAEGDQRAHVGHPGPAARQGSGPGVRRCVHPAGAWRLWHQRRTRAGEERNQPRGRLGAGGREAVPGRISPLIRNRAGGGSGTGRRRRGCRACGRPRFSAS